MNRQLHLETQAGENRRYSFLETPLEMHSSAQYADVASALQPRVNPASSTQPAVPQRVQQQEQPAQYTVSEKTQQFQQQGIIPTYSNYPAPEHHPAHHAPIADARPQHSDMQMHPLHYNQPPSSPGPLSSKTYPEPQPEPHTSPRDTMSVAPDTNPFQSPKSPYLPPPVTASTSQAPPAADDLSWNHQPGQILHPNQEALGGTWSHGLCECSNFGACCLGLICPCILYGRTQHRLSMKSCKEDPTNILGYQWCNGSCTTMALLCGCQWLMATVQHTRTRKSYGIQGNIASDCLRSTCCTCCTLIQDEKEIQKREELRTRAARERGATLTSPYTAPGAMAYTRPPS